jgi:hypothetical protein
MSGAEVPKGSYAAGRKALLPRGAERPITIFVNGVEQVEGTDYEIRGREIVFSRSILKEEKLSTLRWLTMLIGVVGTYRKHEMVDIEYRSGGQTKLASDVAIMPG